MKQFILILVIVFSFFKNNFGQELVLINDTINKFQIGVPLGWRYGVPNDKSAVFMAYNQNPNDNTMKFVVRINIFQKKEKDLEREYDNFIKKIAIRDGFKIIEQRDMVINNRKYKYLIENHNNALDKSNMIDIILLANNNGEVLMLTLASPSENFEQCKELCNKIVESINY